MSPLVAAMIAALRPSASPSSNVATFFDKSALHVYGGGVLCV